MPRATIFDLDDTLVDSGHAWERVCADYAARHGHRWTAQDSATLHGNGGWVAFLAGLCGGDVDRAEMVETCAAAIADLCAAGHVAPLPGALDLVREAERHGAVGLASASPRRYVHAALDSLGLSPRMSVVVCGEDVARGKPDPEPYLRAAAGIGLAPADCLAVEDSPNGIRSAASAGLTVLAVPRGGMTLTAEIGELTAAQARTAHDAVPVLTELLAESLVYGGA